MGRASARSFGFGRRHAKRPQKSLSPSRLDIKLRKGAPAVSDGSPSREAERAKPGLYVARPCKSTFCCRSAGRPIEVTAYRPEKGEPGVGRFPVGGGELVACAVHGPLRI